MICSIAVTVACFMFPNLVQVYGGEEGKPFYKDLSYVFYHGFDRPSSLVHLMLNLILMLIMFSFVEKLMGSFWFLIYLTASIVVYGYLIQKLELLGLASTGAIWSCLPIAYFGMYEGRRLKTRSVYEDYYRLLRLIFLLMILLIPAINIFLQFFLRGDIPLKKAAFHGVTPFAIALGFGVLSMLFFKKHIKQRLKYFHKKKKLEYPILDKSARYLALIYPVYIILVFLIYRV